jgi:hypothetical protein
MRLHLRRRGDGAGAACAPLRMGLSEAPLMLGAATNVEDILATLESGKPPAIVAIDSIQTLWTGALDAAPGHHRPGAHRQFRSGALCQGIRRGAAAGRPCHQGRPDRRPQGGRASGGCGALFRGRARPPFPRVARR